VATAALAALPLVGCGDDDDDETGAGTGTETATTPSAASSPVAAATPKTGGTLRVHSPANPVTFDLHSNVSFITVVPSAPMFNGLIQMNPHKDSEMIADLATAMPELPDSKTYIFHITPDVRFHDGSIMTAADVKANYDWMRSPPSGKTSHRKDILSVIDKIETPDASTVKFTLKQPSASFLLNQVVEYMAIGPAPILAADGDLAKNPIGTGPYMMKDFQPGVSVELLKHPQYFRKGLPYLDGMVIHIVGDRRTALENFLGGKLHTLSPNVEEAKEIRSRASEKFKLTDVVGNGRNLVYLNTSKSPMSDPRAREALSLLFDRQEHLALVYQGKGNPLGGCMAPGPGGKWSLPEAELRKISGYDNADVARAKVMLSEAGLGDGASLKLVTRDIYQDLAVWTTEQLRKVGISATPQLLDSAGAYAVADSGAFDIMPWGGFPALDDPDAVFTDVGGMTFAARNFSKTNDPEIDRLYLEQTKTMDVTARKKLVNDLDRRILSTFQSITLGYSSTTFATAISVQNKIWHFSENYTNRTMEDVWLDA
jgi:peptide/nickel transport system substrate-binding protein